MSTKKQRTERLNTRLNNDESSQLVYVFGTLSIKASTITNQAHVFADRQIVYTRE